MKYGILTKILAVFFIAFVPRVVLADDVSTIKDPTAHVRVPTLESAAQTKNCPSIPSPQNKVNGNSFYTDQKHSVIDPSMFQKAADQESEVRGYTRQLDNIANSLIAANTPRSPNSACLKSWLLTWAEAAALTGETEDNGNNYRVWALTPIAQAFNIIRPISRPYDPDEQTISHWIGQLAQINKEYIQRKDIRNNISYWAGAGIALASISTQNRSLLTYSMSVAETGILTITTDGFLPGEVNRGQRALEYTGFALDPLSIIAEVAYVNGTDLFSVGNNAILRCGLNLIHSEKDTKIFDAKAGVKQSVTLPVPIGNYGWTEIAQKHNDTPELLAFVSAHRPIKFDRMGGNVTTIYGSR